MIGEIVKEKTIDVKVDEIPGMIENLSIEAIADSAKDSPFMELILDTAEYVKKRLDFPDAYWRGDYTKNDTYHDYTYP